MLNSVLGELVKSKVESFSSFVNSMLTDVRERYVNPMVANFSKGVCGWVFSLGLGRLPALGDLLVEFVDGVGVRASMRFPFVAHVSRSAAACYGVYGVGVNYAGYHYDKSELNVSARVYVFPGVNRLFGYAVAYPTLQYGGYFMVVPYSYPSLEPMLLASAGGVVLAKPNMRLSSGGPFLVYEWLPAR